MFIQAPPATTFLSLRNLEVIAQVRLCQGLIKEDVIDVRILRQIYNSRPSIFVEERPELLHVKSLTELWRLSSDLKKRLRYAHRTGMPDTFARTMSNYVKQLSRLIHKQAVKIPLYKRLSEELSLQGPSVAYVITHADLACGRHKLLKNFQLYNRGYRRRTPRSRMLILLAYAVVRNKHPKYYETYKKYYAKFREMQTKNSRWKALLRTSERILLDRHKIAVKESAADHQAGGTSS
ncbi:MAG: hypothetical protein QXV62_00345 [Nitrososphaerota archaeon]